jgi:hypothetical protein
MGTRPPAMLYWTQGSATGNPSLALARRRAGKDRHAHH